MDDFPKAKSEDARRFCIQIQKILVQVCGKTDVEAVRLINELWKDRDDIESDPLLYHECPWYYAMVIAHHPVIGDNHSQWWKDTRFWPPPAEWRGF